MSNTYATMPGATADLSGERAISRLADRIASMAPSPPVLELDNPLPPVTRPSPAVAAAMSRTAAMSVGAAQRAAKATRRRSFLGAAIDGFIAACSFIPYAAVALALRLVIARVFFLDGQSRVEGLQVPIHIPNGAQGFDFSFVLPMQVKAETFTAFMTQYALLPLPPALAAYTVSYAEFILPVMLVLGLGTRFAALGLLIMTAMIQLFVMPESLWSAHIYWAAILLVLMSRGPGAVSLDALIRFLARR